MKKLLFTLIVLMVICFPAFAEAKVVPNTVGNVTSEVMKQAFDSLNSGKAMSTSVQVGDKTIITFFEVKSFFLNGTFGTPVQGSGVFGKLDFTPYAVMIVSPEEVKMIPVMKEKPIFSQIIDAIPSIVETVMKYFMVDQSSGIISEKQPIIENSESKTYSGEDTEEASKIYDTSDLTDRLMSATTKEEFTSISKECEELLTGNPNNPTINAVAGYALMRTIDEKTPPLQQMTLAMKSQNLLEKAAKLDPENVVANLGLGWMNLYSPMGSVDKSISLFEKVIASEPGNMDAMVGLIQGFEKKGQTDKAKEIAKKGLEINPDMEYFKNILK